MSRFFFAIPLVTVSTVAGCTFRVVDGPSSTGTYTSSAASGGDTVTSGTGMDMSGAGGGDASSASSTAATSGSGGNSCVGPQGTGETAAACDGTSVANASCGGQPSLGYGTCKRGFAIFLPGPAEALASCLAHVPAAQACATDPVQTCIDQMYGSACHNDTAVSQCATWADVCAKNGDTLDQGKCASDLNPMSDAAINDVAACMNKASGGCQARYDGCYDQELAIQ